MKTGTVTIRLPIDKIERLKGLAEKRGCSLSELLREPISTWLDLEAIGGGASEEVIAELRKLMESTTAAHIALTELATATLRMAAGARVMANKAAENTDEVVSYMSSNEPLSQKTKRKWQEQRDAESNRIADHWITMALGMYIQQPEPEAESGAGDPVTDS